MDEILNLKYELQQWKDRLILVSEPAHGMDTDLPESSEEKRAIEKNIRKLKEKIAKLENRQ